MRAQCLTQSEGDSSMAGIPTFSIWHDPRRSNREEIAMIIPALRVILLVGLLIFPAASATIVIPEGAALSHSGPIMCGPGPDC